MSVLFGFALLALIAPAIVRIGLRARRSDGADAPARWLALVVTALPESHREWGRAMCAELEAVSGAAPRRRFSVGCARAAGLIWARATLTSRERGGGGLRALIGAGLGAALALVGYGLVRYPHLISGTDEVIAAVAFPALLLAYGWATLALSRGTGRHAVTGRRHGLLGGAVIGAAWLLVLSPTEQLKQWVLVPLLIALLGPACLAITAGTRAALWSGLVGGLFVFTVWLTATYVRDGRPYDAQLQRDFHHSGAPDLATLAVGDNLGSALTLLALIPLMALAVGSLTARLSRAT